MNAIKHQDWDPTAYKYRDPWRATYGDAAMAGFTRRTVVSTQNNKFLRLQTPAMTVSCPTTFPGSSKLSALGHFASVDDPFLLQLQQFQAKVLDDATAQSSTWFDTDLSKECVEAKYASFFRKHKKIKKTKKSSQVTALPPSLIISIPDKGVEIYDADGKPLHSVDSWKEFDWAETKTVVCLLECSGVWSNNTGAWGLKWEAVQFVVVNK